MRTLLPLLLATSLVHASEAPLPDDFYSARPSVQLFKAYAAFKMAEYQQARQMWLSIEGEGRGEALFNLGILYEEGLGVEADLARALRCYRDAARAGSRAAAFRLGMLYLHDPRLAGERAQARDWLALAAYRGAGASAGSAGVTGYGCLALMRG
jgi:TPR repeat protein